MRRILSLFALLALLQAAAGCRHVAGVCDCCPTNGDAAVYAGTRAYAEPIATPPKEVLNGTTTIPNGVGGGVRMMPPPR